MKGLNELHVCEAEMIAMVQSYFDGKYLGLLKAEVTGVEWNNQEGFVVHLTEAVSFIKDEETK